MDDLASNRRGPACCLPVSERRLDPVAPPEPRNRALLPRELVNQRVDLSAPREGERCDIFAESPFVERLLSNGRTRMSRRQQARQATRLREGEG